MKALGNCQACGEIPPCNCASVDNPPAFPRDHRHLGHNGMQLRDYFAAHVDVKPYSPVDTFKVSKGRTPTIEELAEYIASIRIIEADAMLAARKLQTGAGT